MSAQDVRVDEKFNGYSKNRRVQIGIPTLKNGLMPSKNFFSYTSVMNWTINLLVTALIGIPMVAQINPALTLAKHYPTFKHADVSSRRFTHEQLHNWIAPLVDDSRIRKTTIGRSAEGRTIWMYSVGHGPTKVLLWSQMHGDEPTATMALVDILRLVATMPQEEVVRVLCERYTLLMIPMLNPDGAERFTRRTAQLIDMNRDALALQTPEARVLKEIQQREKPTYGFNLHDQDLHYMVGATRKHTAIALLAPPTDETRGDNAVRTQAKELAGTIAEVLDRFLPGHIAKWDDTFEPRAFGDNVQRWGTSTVLIESGASPGDSEKMELRRLNVIGIVAGLLAVNDPQNAASRVERYERLPFNNKAMFDLLIQNASYQAAPTVDEIRVDLGINFDQSIDKDGRVIRTASIVEFGDLSTFAGYRTENASGKKLNTAKIRMESPFSADEISLLFGN
jgi:hypothetical protein